MKLLSKGFPLATMLLIISLSFIFAANKNQPHKHQGILQPYKPEKPTINLSQKQKNALLSGNNVKEQLLQGDGGRAMVIQDVHAPCTIVWDRILDFPGYPKMVPKVTQCENYEVNKEKDGSERIMTRMRLGVFGVKIEYFIRHCYYPSLSTCTWTLDYSRSSDLDESVGYWYVQNHPDQDKKDWSRVYYSVALVPPSWIPGIVKTFLTKQALTQATAWVKANSEKQYAQSNAKQTSPVSEKSIETSASEGISPFERTLKLFRLAKYFALAVIGVVLFKILSPTMTQFLI